MLRLTREGAARLFGRPSIDGLAPGSQGGVLTATLDFVELPTDWAPNVIAILPGSDPKLKTQDVAVGTHNDHVGFTTPVDKDPIKAFNDIRNRLLLANSMNGLGPEMPTTFPVNMDSRSDHDDYAQQGISIACFSTGLHRDYHQWSDEPECIDSPHCAKMWPAPSGHPDPWFSASRSRPAGSCLGRRRWRYRPPASFAPSPWR